MTRMTTLCCAVLALAAVAVLPGAGALAATGPSAADVAPPQPGVETAQAAPAGGGSTRSVNIAIVVLGTLWVGLMARRIQLHSAAGSFRSAAPQPAAGGR